MPNNRCSNCIAFNSECTHSNVRKRSVPYPPPSTSKRDTSTDLPSFSSTPHVSPQMPLLSPTTTIHPLIQPLLSSSSLDSSTHLSLVALSRHIFQLEQEISNLKQGGGSTTTASSSRDSSSSPQVSSSIINEERPPPLQPSLSSSRNDDVHLSSQLKRLVISTSQTRHFGSSSTMSLLGVALQVGKEKNKMPFPDGSFRFRRPEYWNIHQWEHLPEEDVATYEFPDRELMHELTRLYFDHVNVHFPLLHRPTFVKAIIDGLYLRDHNFGATVLGVCAIASRYSDNPAVLLEGNDSKLTSGWKWFAQIRQCWRSTARTPLLGNIQTICLAILYMHGTSQPEACWVMVGIGIRIAQDVGAHRKRFMEIQSVESELWKRCFWVLVCIDALVCSFLGRPRATISYDYDLDMPIDCDDEYWETDDPSLEFQQPPGKPSKVSSFITYIKLIGILEYAQRFLYSVNRKRKGCPSGGPPGWQSDEDVVSRLDSDLNEWFENMPDHLKWASCSPGSVFYAQSALLHACYYHVRILVHRPFIPLPKKPSPLPFPSLAICTNAARSCAHLLKTYSENGPLLPFPQVQFAVFTSAILLLVSHWTNSKSSSRDCNNEDLKRVQDCISVLSKFETRWTAAGRLCDVVREIASYPEAQCNQYRNGANDGQTVSELPNSQSQSLQGPEYSPQLPWDSHVFAQPEGWNTTTQRMPDTTHVGSLDGEWWDNPGLNAVQFDFTPLGPFPHVNALRPPVLDSLDNPQWSFMPQDVSMEVSDVAMLWLQQPQMSEYVPPVLMKGLS